MTADPHRTMNPWMLTALVLLIAGYGAAGWMARGFLHDGTGLQLMEAPGAAALSLGDAGRWTLYHEFEGIVHGDYYYQDPRPRGLRVTATDAATSRPLTLTPFAQGDGYRFGTRKGTPMAQFTLDRPGPVRFEARYEDGAGSVTMLAVAPAGQPESTHRRLVWIMTLTLLTTLAAGLTALTGMLRTP